MAVQSTYRGVTPVPIIANSGNASIGRGLRVTAASDGTVALQDNTARGEFVTLGYVEAGQPGVGVQIQNGGEAPCVAAEAVTAGDTAYTATNGQVGKTSGGGNVLIGKWVDTTASGALGTVRFENPL